MVERMVKGKSVFVMLAKSAQNGKRKVYNAPNDAYFCREIRTCPAFQPHIPP